MINAFYAFYQLFVGRVFEDIPLRTVVKHLPGNEIIFEDNLAGEQLGEFPSQWDLIEGNVDVAQMDGENVISFLFEGGNKFRQTFGHAG